jgi:hypothetical protein
MRVGPPCPHDYCFHLRVRDLVPRQRVPHRARDVLRSERVVLGGKFDKGLDLRKGRIAANVDRVDRWEGLETEVLEDDGAEEVDENGA